MQLENAVAELKTTDNLQPFVEVNPYREPLAKAEQFAALIKNEKVHADSVMTETEMMDMIREINHEYLNLQDKKELLKKKEEDLKNRLNVLEPFCPLEVDLNKVTHYPV